MAKRDFATVAFPVRSDYKQRALQQALLVPWCRLEETASAYVGWHMFILWVRAIAEHEAELPEIVRAELEARCPGFLEDDIGRRQRLLSETSLWHSVQEWIAAHDFAEAKAQGWFDAVMFYAYKDPRTEQAWSLWESTKEAWNEARPSQWPSFEDWTATVIGTHLLAEIKSEKARAVQQLAHVDPARLRTAVSELIESRAFALWLASISQPKHALGELALEELRGRCPDFLTQVIPEPSWDRSLFFRLVRFGEAEWRATARAERWYAALRYEYGRHPRYHRIVHYLHRCQEEWFRVPPRSHPSFADWLSAADEYFLAPTA